MSSDISSSNQAVSFFDSKWKFAFYGAFFAHLATWGFSLVTVVPSVGYKGVLSIAELAGIVSLILTVLFFLKTKYASKWLLVIMLLPTLFFLWDNLVNRTWNL